MTKRDQYLDNIRKQLSVFEVGVRLNNRSNRQNINISAEDILGGLLNLIYGWNLHNANSPGRNARAIDLADWKKGIVVQVSATNESGKIQKTLEPLRDPQFGSGRIKKLVVVLLRPKKKYKTVFEHDGFDLEILDLNDISTAAEHGSMAKLRQISDFLDESLGLLPGQPMPGPVPADRPVHMLPPAPAAAACFLPDSRDEELEILHDALEAGGPVLIWGLAGMGKTQTAIQLARRYAPRRGAYFLRYTIPDRLGREAMFETIRRAEFSGYCLDAGGETDPEALMELEYRQKLEILRREYADTLLIIDHFDWPGRSLEMLKAEQSFRDIAALTNLGVRLAFTTRYPADPDWEIGPLPEHRLLELMEKSCAGYDDEQLLPLIRAVDRHTLMVDLMARLLDQNMMGLTPADILDALAWADEFGEDLPAVTGEKDGLYPQAKLHQHLRTLFNLSGLGDAERKVLSLATLIADGGLDDALFYRSLSEAEREALQHVCNCGWLRRENHLITIHPMVWQVCYSELELREADVRTFLDALWRNHGGGEQTLRRVALCMDAGADYLTCPEERARCRERMLHLWERILAADDPALAEYYGKVATTYLYTGEHGKRLELQARELEIYRKILPPDAPEIARSHTLMGITHMEMGDYAQALDSMLERVKLQQNDPVPDDRKLAIAWHNAGMMALFDEQYGQAYEYLSRALELYCRVYPDGHPDIDEEAETLAEIRLKLQEQP